MIFVLSEWWTRPVRSLAVYWRAFPLPLDAEQGARQQADEQKKNFTACSMQNRRDFKVVRSRLWSSRMSVNAQ